MDETFLARFMKGIASTGAATAVQIGLGMLGLMIAARLISETQMGVFVLINIMVLLFAILGGLAQETVAVTRCLAAAEGGEKIRMISSVIGFRLLITLVMSTLIFAGKPLLHPLVKDPGAYGLLNYLPLIYSLQSFDDCLRKIMQGLHFYQKLAMAQAAQAVSRIVLILIFLLVFKMGVAGLLWAMIASFALSCGIQYAAIPGPRRITFDFPEIRRVFRFGFPLGVNGLLTFVFAYLDNFMIGAMLNTAQVAYYSMAAKIPENLRRMYTSFCEVFFPNMSEMLAREKYVEAERVLNLSLRTFAGLAAFLSLTLGLFARDVMLLLFSEKYQVSASALPLLMMNLSITIIANMLGTTLVALGRSDTPVKINSVTTFVNLAGNIVMIPRFGFMGAVYATLLANILTHPVLLFFYRKGPIRVHPMSYLKPFLLLAACGGLYGLAGMTTLAMKIGVVLLFLTGSFLFAVITVKDIQAVGQAVKTMVYAKKQPVAP